MKNVYFAAGVALLVLISAGGCKKKSAPETGPVRFDNVARIPLSKPTTEAAAYLGIQAQTENVFLSDVNSPVLLVHLFDMYCTVCQQHAPEVNRLYRMVQNSPIKNRVRFIGIGKGNTAIEAEIYQDRYAIEFPLFPDADKSRTKLLGVDYTPNFVIVDLKNRRVPHHQWKMESAEALFEKLQAATK